MKTRKRRPNFLPLVYKGDFIIYNKLKYTFVLFQTFSTQLYKRPFSLYKTGIILYECHLSLFFVGSDIGFWIKKGAFRGLLFPKNVS
ncbi:MAG: hypothetical protein A2W85_18525 [Bacteroidetes bacterium GWF2_41_31]|nr:MAG: hypothetical protein A2W85_18525 [Bacteroidetes bacterium GWF2_41_31]